MALRGTEVRQHPAEAKCGKGTKFNSHAVCQFYPSSKSVVVVVVGGGRVAQVGPFSTFIKRTGVSTFKVVPMRCTAPC